MKEMSSHPQPPITKQPGPSNKTNINRITAPKNKQKHKQTNRKQQQSTETSASKQPRRSRRRHQHSRPKPEQPRSRTDPNTRSTTEHVGKKTTNTDLQQKRRSGKESRIGGGTAVVRRSKLIAPPLTEVT